MPIALNRAFIFGCGALALSVGVPLVAHAQALTSITSLYVGYNSRKVSVAPTGELKAQLDSLDRELQVASRFGQTGHMRRLLAKGNTLLAGRRWTDTTDYQTSLLLRTEQSLADPAKPLVVRLEQLYAPRLQLTRSLRAEAALTARAPGSSPTARPVVVKAFGTYEGVARDLRESPFMMVFDVRDVPDGRYGLAVQVMDSSQSLGTASLNVVVRAGLAESMEQLTRAATSAPAALRAELLFPVDRVERINRGDLEVRTFDVASGFAAADSVLAAVREDRDPFTGRTGDMKRHYVLERAREVMPYRLYVPTTYSAATPMPVIVALHGLGQTEDSFFDGYSRALPRLAEQHGYLLVAPLGYRVDGGYGWGVGAAPTDRAARHRAEMSELDVMESLAQVRALYNVDPDRVYLMGHSLGAIGTWKMAARFPGEWAAIGAFSGQGVPSTMSRMAHIPAFVVHGDDDPTVGVGGSRAMVEAMKVQGVDHVYIEVPGGDHVNMVVPHLPGMVEFFNTRRRSGGAR